MKITGKLEFSYKGQKEVQNDRKIKLKFAHCQYLLSGKPKENGQVHVKHYLSLCICTFSTQMKKWVL